MKSSGISTAVVGISVIALLVVAGIGYYGLTQGGNPGATTTSATSTTSTVSSSHTSSHTSTSSTTHSTSTSHSTTATSTTTSVSTTSSVSFSTSTSTHATSTSSMMTTSHSSTHSTTQASTVSCTTSPSAQGDVAISIMGSAFIPSTVNITAGQSIQWTNNDSIAHTVTGTSPPWSGGGTPLSHGQTVTCTFSVAGDFSYHCAFHQSMIGSVKVNP